MEFYKNLAQIQKNSKYLAEFYKNLKILTKY